MSKVRTFRKGKALDIFTSYLFVLPVILGILLFTLVPMITSLYYSFTDYNPTLVNAKPAFVGIQNFADAFGKNWKAVGNSLFVTISYTFITVPLNLVLSFAIAMLLNQKLKGMRVFRTIYYIPVIIPAVASGLLWNDITKVNGGMFNVILTEFLKLPPYQFYNSAETVLPSLIFIRHGRGHGLVDRAVERHSRKSVRSRKFRRREFLCPHLPHHFAHVHAHDLLQSHYGHYRRSADLHAGITASKSQ